MGFFAKIKEGLKKTRDKISFSFNKLFTGGALDDDFYDELEEILLTADIGVDTTLEILERLRERVNKNLIRRREDVRDALKDILVDILTENETVDYTFPIVILVAGVNGVGKTTAVGKLAKYFKSQNKTVTLVAADTFRAAASEQLTVWAQRADVRIIKHNEGADPASVVYDGIASAKSKNTDVLIIDTAGRLHNKVNLMNELGKINRIIDRDYPESQKWCYLVLDATTGQNAIEQAEVFDDIIDIDGVILTKLDGTAKGGVTIAVTSKLQIPVEFIGVGEGIDDLQKFDAQEFVLALLAE